MHTPFILITLPVSFHSSFNMVTSSPLICPDSFTALSGYHKRVQADFAFLSSTLTSCHVSGIVPHSFFLGLFLVTTHTPPVLFQDFFLPSHIGLVFINTRTSCHILRVSLVVSLGLFLATTHFQSYFRAPFGNCTPSCLIFRTRSGHYTVFLSHFRALSVVLCPFPLRGQVTHLLAAALVATMLSFTSSDLS